MQLYPKSILGNLNGSAKVVDKFLVQFVIIWLDCCRHGLHWEWALRFIDGFQSGAHVLASLVHFGSVTLAQKEWHSFSLTCFIMFWVAKMACVIHNATHWCASNGPELSTMLSMNTSFPLVCCFDSNVVDSRDCHRMRTSCGQVGDINLRDLWCMIPKLDVALLAWGRIYMRCEKVMCLQLILSCF